jgi:site-specific DNA-methyltransferase (adenine-specific)
MIELLNEDNMVLMSRYPDKYFDLAIVDPEFGIGIAKSPRLVTDKGLKAKTWDDKPIDEKYFTELFRVSKNQIIWGGNYYNLGITKHCIIWDKKQPEGMSFGMFDFAWTSFEGANKMFSYSVQKEQNKIHPTQKPVELYRWLLHNYTKQGDRVLDTHLGSGSIAIACHDMGFDLVACEIDKDYYDAACKRFNEQTKQLKLIA